MCIVHIKYLFSWNEHLMILRIKNLIWFMYLNLVLPQFNGRPVLLATLLLPWSFLTCRVLHSHLLWRIESSTLILTSTMIFTTSADCFHHWWCVFSTCVLFFFFSEADFDPDSYKIPFVVMSLSTLASEVHSLLQSHDGTLPLLRWQPAL